MDIDGDDMACVSGDVIKMCRLVRSKFNHTIKKAPREFVLPNGHGLSSSVFPRPCPTSSVIWSAPPGGRKNKVKLKSRINKE